MKNTYFYGMIESGDGIEADQREISDQWKRYRYSEEHKDRKKMSNLEIVLLIGKLIFIDYFLYQIYPCSLSVKKLKYY